MRTSGEIWMGAIPRELLCPESSQPEELPNAHLVLVLRLAYLLRLLLSHGGGFVGQLKLRSRSVVLHVVRQVIRTGQRLTGDVDLAAGRREAACQKQAAAEQGAAAAV